MKAVVWHDVGDIRLDDVLEPTVEQPTDAVARLTSSAICGTDLHFVRGTMAGMKPGTIPGHEGVGVVEPHLVELVCSGVIDPVQILTKVELMPNVIEAYKAFDKREPGWLKTELRPVAAE
jgi:threonine dehydrogenase-like Zn-dependent dehydrogenase